MAGNLPVFIRNDVRGPYQYARLQAENPGVAAPVIFTGCTGFIIQGRHLSFWMISTHSRYLPDPMYTIVIYHTREHE